MHERVDTMKLDECFINNHDMSKFYEWTNISMAKYAAGENITLLTRFRKNT